MSITWAKLRDRVLRVLDDIERDDESAVAFTNDDMLDYIGDALTAIATHTAAERVYAGTFDDEVWSVELPDDFMALGTVSVIGTERVLLTPRPLSPGASVANVGSSIVGGSVTAYDVYYVYPRGTINFLKPIPAGNAVQVDYWGYWARVEGVEDTLKVPRWMEEPLRWYCLHLAMSKPMVSIAKLANYKTRLDSGDPLDNPQLELSRYFKRRYDELLSEMPPQDRTGWESQ